ncbi:hypothetical protein TW85_19215 [Marinomonas sp. S3726]|uniref:WYL domain-containing protein n=1 Tax=Marinomonas sp. S3726 TaxID=579484 RepID=UPI0005FA3CE0|nr:hypothetical protein [Marinomonas sp. S3726]KJZ10849.1 hypothetical protein TW85_19215 [Marinomonas sp. S3726]
MQYSQYIKPVIASDEETVSITGLASKRLESGAHSHPQWLRLCFIERQLLWERRLTTSMIIEAFGISRPQAQKDIKLYQQLSPEALKPYKLGIPYHQPTEYFEPVLLSSADLQWHAIEEYASPKTSYTTEMPVLSRRHNLRVLARLLSAIEHHRSVEAVVATMSSPKGRGRRLTPTAISFVKNRYHVRAYCWDNLDYRDFIIGRFKSTPKVVKPTNNPSGWGNNAPAFERYEGIPIGPDVEWDQMIELELQPNPNLSIEQQLLIISDYGLDVNSTAKRVTLRKPLIGYFLVDNRIPATKDEYKIATKDNPIAWPVFAFILGSNKPAHELGFISP